MFLEKELLQPEVVCIGEVRRPSIELQGPATKEFQGAGM